MHSQPIPKPTTKLPTYCLKLLNNYKTIQQCSFLKKISPTVIYAQYETCKRPIILFFKHRMGQKIVITLTDWSEEDKQYEVGGEGEQRLSHCSLMVGEREQVKRQLKEVLTSHGYEILSHAKLQ